LLQELIGRMAADRVARVFVEPWDDNSAGVYAYESLGFEPSFKIPALAKQYP
jgi:hypothetical protein